MVKKEIEHAEEVTEILGEDFAMLETKLKEAEEAIRSRDNEINALKSNVDVLVGRVRKLALSNEQPKAEAATETNPTEQPMEGSATKIAALEARVVEIEEIVRQKETAAKALEQNLSVKIQDFETQLRNKNKLLVDRNRQVKDLTSQLKAVTSRMKKMSSFLRQAEALANIEARDPGTVAAVQSQREKDHPATAQLSGLHLTSTAADQATVSLDLFDRIIQELSQIMGPMAPMIVRHDVAALGESIEKFPRKRLAELLDIVTKEVMDENLKSTLRERFVEIL